MTEVFHRIEAHDAPARLSLFDALDPRGAPAHAQRVARNGAPSTRGPRPQWWSDAKFGIFIHWGVYSVPAFAPKGEYAEWYWERLRAPGDAADAKDQKIRAETRAFHERNYGRDFDYAAFAPQFRAEMFDADEWAKTLKESGAKYVVLVSKHHDGFALWPSTAGRCRLGPALELRRGGAEARSRR